MSLTSRTIWLRVTALVLALIPVPGLLAQQPSLADVANREEQRRKAVSQPSKVYTNADLPPSTFWAPPPAISAASPATAPPTVQSPQPNPLNDGGDSRRSEFCEGCARDASGHVRRSELMKRAFMDETGFPDGRPGWIIDHIRPLACGGADDPSNMQWQTRADSDAKDRIEPIDCQGEVLPPWQVPIIIGNPIVLPPSCGVNTARQQAMSNFMRDAGFRGSNAPLPPCAPATAP